MPYVLPDTRQVAPDAAFSLGDVQYARGWLRRASQSERDALAITWEDPPAPPPPALTKEHVNSARDVYLDAGVMVTVTGYVTPIHVQCRAGDWDSLHGLAIEAKERIGAGDTTTMTGFRCASDQMHSLTPPQLAELWQKVFDHRKAVYAASWTLKAMDPIPGDFASNATHWPANGQPT